MCSYRTMTPYGWPKQSLVKKLKIGTCSQFYKVAAEVTSDRRRWHQTFLVSRYTSVMGQAVTPPWGGSGLRFPPWGGSGEVCTGMG